MAKVFVRPGALELIHKLKKEGFEVILFTAGNKHYMESIVSNIFPKVKGKEAFHHCLSRDDMRVLANFGTQQGELVKDLTCLLEGRQLRNIILVDNSEQKCFMQPKNLIPIQDFKGEANDDQLKSLADYLISFKGVKDVRSKIVEDFHN
jgi:TFIIF-interacting CTD phosphatase-like protein